jgi:hypothetical protein
MEYGVLLQLLVAQHEVYDETAREQVRQHIAWLVFTVHSNTDYMS